MNADTFATGLIMVVTGVGALLIFGFTIFVHELGHFLAARRLGMVVEKFAIGFGPVIWARRIDGVEYSVRWLPLGGFVSLPQMAPMEMVEGASETSRADLPEVSPWARMVTAFAGPLFSFLLAFGFAVVVWVVGVPEPRIMSSTTIGWVEPDSPAAAAGLQPGDRIVSINGEKPDRWVKGSRSVVTLIVLSAGEVIQMEVERQGERLKIPVRPRLDAQLEDLRNLGIGPSHPLVVESIIADSPAERAGFLPGDELVTINGQGLFSLQQMQAITDEYPGPLRIGFRRQGGEIQEATVLPRMPEINGFRPLSGFQFAFDEVNARPNPFYQVWDSSTLIFRTLQAVLRTDSDVGIQHLSGPVGIFETIRRLLERGILQALTFGVVLNVNLAILNLLPLPILDGGHIVLNLYEVIRRRAMNVKVLYALQSACFVLLLGFVLLVTFNDTLRVTRQRAPSQLELLLEHMDTPPRFFAPEAEEKP